MTIPLPSLYPDDGHSWSMVDSCTHPSLVQSFPAGQATSFSKQMQMLVLPAPGHLTAGPGVARGRPGCILWAQDGPGRAPAPLPRHGALTHDLGPGSENRDNL